MGTRYAFLDVYRGIIVLLMIEGHVVRELLSPVLQSTALFRIHELIHGITGPGFLFGAGITFGISAQRRWPEFLALTPALLRRIRKLALLILIGYALHLPFFSLQKTLAEASPGAWISFYSFDVLQCIGFSLLGVHILILVLRKERLFVISLLLLIPAVLLSAPFVWNWAQEPALPAAVSMALQGKNGSVYPLFPYSAFLFSGGFASYEFLKYAKNGMETAFIRRLALAGISTVLLGTIIGLSPVSSYENQDFWHTGPGFMVMKLGVLFLLLSGSWLLGKRLQAPLRWIVLLGKESLFVYVLHLLLLYGSVVNAEAHLSDVWHSLGWGSALAVTAGFTLSLYLMARLWHALKIEHPMVFRSIVWWMIAVFVAEFLTRPY